MWLSRRVMQESGMEDPATLGTVTIGGKEPAVLTDAEKRRAKVISPGGYCWNPAATDCVLVVKGTSVKIGNDGKIHLTGDVYVEGDLYVDGQKMEVP